MFTKYKCNNSKCDATDSDRSSHPPLALVCWKCKAGRETKSYQQQMELREGMFPLNDAGVFPWEMA